MPRYTERSPSPRAWIALLVVCVVLYVGVTVLAGGNLAPGIPLVAIVGAVSALTMWSIGRYGDVTLTDDELRAGRARIRIADIDPWGVSPAGEQPQGKLVGGAFASSMNKATIGLTLRTGERVRVQTDDPAALRAALEHALEPHRTTP